jgi:hypothetical protein
VVAGVDVDADAVEGDRGTLSSDRGDADSAGVDVDGLDGLEILSEYLQETLRRSHIRQLGRSSLH